MKGHFMKNNNTQTGSIHLIITVVLVIALLGSLGFVFWQNVIQKKSDTVSKQQTPDTNKPITNSTPTPPTEVALTEIATDKLAGTNLAIKYPNNWQVSHDSFGPKDAVVYERYDISNPDKTIIVHFWVSNGGFGGTCEKIDGDEIQYINKKSLSAFPNAEYIEYYFSNGYFAGIHQNDRSTDSAKIGDSACNLGLSGSLMPIKNTGNVENMALHLEMEFPEVGHNGVSSVERFKETIKTDDFKTAKRIVESLYVKN